MAYVGNIITKSLNDVGSESTDVNIGKNDDSTTKVVIGKGTLQVDKVETFTPDGSVTIPKIVTDSSFHILRHYT